MGEVKVLRAGSLTTVQDLGRPGQRALGVAPGGVLDACAARVANILVGNPAGAALLEVALGGVRLLFAEDRAIAWCGGEFAVDITGEKIPPGRRIFVRRGEELALGSSARGGRAWLALAGGIDLPPVLGSRSTDLRSGFGGYQGRALRDDDELSLGETAPSTAGDTRSPNWSAPLEWSRRAERSPILRVVYGAEWGDFTRRAQVDFLQTPFAVSVQTDRMGARLEGAELRRKKERELLSEAVAPGTVQVAHDGQPILLLGDCQTIGGYPKIAHVITVDLGLAAQLRPNDIVRFQSVSRPEATALYAERERDLQLFGIGVQLRSA